MVWPARSLDAIAQIGQHFLIDGDGERLDRDRILHEALPGGNGVTCEALGTGLGR